MNKFWSKEHVLAMLQANINEYQDRDWFKERKLQPVRVFYETKRFDNGAFQGYFGYRLEEPGTLFVVDRGSDELLDWLGYNFRFVQKKLNEKVSTKPVVPYENCNTDILVSEGFRDYYFLGRKAVLEEVSHFKKVEFIGHSLGSTAAVFGALDVQANEILPKENIYCYAFACPRMGNKVFRDSFRRRVPNSVMMYFGDDIVVRFPLSVFNDYDEPVIENVICYNDKNYLDPRNWLGKIFGSPADHYPDALYAAIKRLEYE
jgi:hypothetical protein